MKLLAFDTSTSACSLGLLVEDEIVLRHEILPLQQAGTLLPWIDEMLQEKNLKLNQVDGIAFGCGPGSFTGLRIATSVAQGLSYAVNKPLIPVSSLAVLAQTAYEEYKTASVLVAIDARMGEVYWGEFQIGQSGLMELVGKEQLSSPADLKISALNEWLAVGDAWKVYENDIGIQPKQVEPLCLPKASALLTLAKPKYMNKEWVSSAEALPQYLRNRVALKSAERQG